ncbi:MAG: hypothetical protein R3E97_19565 [Candidatus Eisenbacteria bacterium]
MTSIVNNLTDRRIGPQRTNGADLLKVCGVLLVLIAASAVARILGLDVSPDGAFVVAAGVAGRPIRIEHNGHAKVAVGLAAFGAAIAVFFGLRNILGSSTLESWVVPFVAAAVIAYTLFALWHNVLHVTTTIQNSNRKALLVGLAILLTAVTVCISSWFIATAIGKDPALQYHMVDSLERSKTSVSTAYGNGLGARALVPEIITKAAELEAMARLERQNGAYTGSSGPGEVESALDMFAATLRTTAANMEAAYRRIESHHEEATRQIGKMQRLVSSNEGSVEEHQRRFSDLAVSLQSTLVEMQKEDPLEILAQGAIGGLVTVSRRISQSQRGAIQELNAQVADWGNELRRRARDAQESQEPVEPVAFVPMNPGIATATYASKVPGAWSVGIGIDLVPFILFLILMLGHAESGSRQEDTHTESEPEPSRSRRMDRSPESRGERRQARSNGNLRGRSTRLEPVSVRGEKRTQRW